MTYRNTCFTFDGANYWEPPQVTKEIILGERADRQVQRFHDMFLAAWVYFKQHQISAQKFN